MQCLSYSNKLFKNIFGPADYSPLKEAIQNGAFLVDVRTPGEFSMGSVKGAVNIPLSGILNELSKFRSKKAIVVFCRSGNRSRRAKHILEQGGLNNVINGGSFKNVSQIVNTEKF
ncbi:sulfurtransferase [Sphingobacterium sp. CZ-UAM]|nr:sulfurtransferase [Sphingobacterium sp. CZ-UAM]